MTEDRAHSLFDTWPDEGPPRTIRDDQPGTGSRVGHCELGAVLRAGRISRTYRATHSKFDIPVAVKIFYPDADSDPEMLRSSLKREAIALARLNHPNVVRVWDVETEGPFPYLATEYVEGYTLEELIRRVGALQTLLGVGLIRQAVEGLDHANRHGIIHRDVKPSNIIVGRDGVVKLLDFGLALIRDTGPLSVPDDFDSVSPVTGTAAYLAPEQAIDPMRVDHRADMYSMGVTLYQALTGRLPFEAGSVLGMITMHLRETPAPPEQVQPKVSQPVSDLIMKLLSKNPDDRFPGYDSLRLALARSVGDRRTPRSQAESIMTFAPIAEEV